LDTEREREGKKSDEISREARVVKTVKVRRKKG
jgi:hypothetical protein